jgi:DNA processing protein
MGCIFYHEESYPPQLREIFDPPLLLYYRGSVPDYGKPLVGVVGTRRPTGAARSAAFSLGWELAGNGIGVVSGLARGIDREVHRGCVRGSGIAVGVLGHGLDRVYPSSSRELARDILNSGGILVSEYPPETPPQRYHFPMRNRIISGLARSVVVVQAPGKSGALITADYALEQGRDLFVHAAGLEGATGEGGLRLSCQGAGLINGAEDIFRDWDGRPPRQSTENSSMSFRTEPLPAPLAIDPDNCRAREEATEDPGKRLAGLLEMELAGRAVRYNGLYYSRKNHTADQEGEE